jgi:hypothetical protein
MCCILREHTGHLRTLNIRAQRLNGVTERLFVDACNAPLRLSLCKADDLTAESDDKTKNLGNDWYFDKVE